MTEFSSTLGFGLNVFIVHLYWSGASGVVAILLSISRRQPAAPASGFPVEPAMLIINPINKAPSCQVSSPVSAIEDSLPQVIAICLF